MTQFDQHHDQRTLEEEPEFNKIVEAALSRRRFLKATGAAGTVGFFAATPLSQAMANASSKHSTKMGFDAIPISTADTIEVPKGYQADVLVSWGILYSKMPINLAKAMAPKHKRCSLVTTTMA